MKFKAAIVSLAMFATSAYAGESFFSFDVRSGPFMVYGVAGETNPRNNPACYAEVTWRDGSKFQLIRDLDDGELYIFVRNNTWNVTDAPGIYNVRINFEKYGSIINGLNFQYNLLNKNTIVIRNIKKETFLPLFSNGNKMIFVMPGSIQNAEVSLEGSTRALTEIANCVDRSTGVNLWPDGKPNGENNNRLFDRI